MNLFESAQIVIDLVFLFLILLMLAGRPWRRTGAPMSAEDQEAYREMIATLSALVREMKQSAAEMEERLGAKQVELGQAIAVADERIGRFGTPVPAAPHPVRAAAVAPAPARIMATEVAEPMVVAAPPPAAEGPSAPAAPDRTERTLEEDDRDRAEKYRQILDLAEKGWSALDIARFTEIPRGEVELLMRTKIRRDG